jgi:hypothetical protein
MDRNGTESQTERSLGNVCIVALLVDARPTHTPRAMMCPVCVHRHDLTIVLRRSIRCVCGTPPVRARCVEYLQLLSLLKKKHALPSWSVLLPTYVHPSSSFVMAAWNYTYTSAALHSHLKRIYDGPRCMAGLEWSRELTSRRLCARCCSVSHTYLISS